MMTRIEDGISEEERVDALTVCKYIKGHVPLGDLPGLLEALANQINS